MTEQEIDLMKRRMEVQLQEYEQAIADAKAWMADWKKRQKRPGFRCVEEQKVV